MAYINTTLPHGELREICRLYNQTFWSDDIGRIYRSQRDKPLAYVAPSIEQFFVDRLEPIIPDTYILSELGDRLYQTFLTRLEAIARAADGASGPSMICRDP